jgi:hypothetical protein
VIQPRVLSVQASAVGPDQQGAVVGLRQTGQRLTSIPIPPLMGGIPDRVRSPAGCRISVHGDQCTNGSPYRPILLFSTPTGDRRFESGSLQRGVYCEPDFFGRARAAAEAHVKAPAGV